MSRENITETPVWKKLKQHAAVINYPENHLKNLLQKKDRFKNFSLEKSQYFL